MRIRSVGEPEWRTLHARDKLKAGDLLDVPLQASLQIATQKTQFGVSGLKQANIEGIEGHLISVTGPSAEKVLDSQTKEGALSVSQLRAGLESGRFESRAPTKEDYERMNVYGVNPLNKYTPTLEETRAINDDFAFLHPPGTEVEDQDQALPPANDARDDPQGPVDTMKGALNYGLYAIVLLLLLIVVVALLRKQR